MTALQRTRLAALAALMAAQCGPPAAADPGPGLDEFLARGEAIGDARFSPDGRSLLFAKEDYAQPSHGMILSPVEGLYVADTASGRTMRLPGGRQRYFEACGTWSPDARHAVFLERRDAAMQPGIIDIRTGREAVFDLPTSTFCNTWVGGRLVYVTPDPDRPFAFSHAGALENLSRRWRDGWDGMAPQVSVHSSNSDFPSPDPAPGGLVVGDPETGKAVMVARGDFDLSISPSPDGRRFAVVRRAETGAGVLDRMTGRRGELQVFEFTADGARRVQVVEAFDAAAGAVAWSPDGRALLAAGRPDAAAAGLLLVLHPGEGRIERIAIPPRASVVSDDPLSALAAFQVGWVGGQPAAILRTEAAAPAPADTRHEYGATAKGALRLFTFGGAEPIDLTSFAAQSVDRFTTSSTGEALVVCGGALWALALDRPARRVTPTSLEILGLAEARPSYGASFIPAVGGGRIALRTRQGQGERTSVVDLATGRVVRAVEAEGLASLAPDLSALARIIRHGWSSALQTQAATTRTVAQTNPEWRTLPTGQIKPFKYRLGDRDLTGWIVLPADYDGRPLPAVMWIYGGQMFGDTPPSAAQVGGGPTPLYSGQLWAREGYAVIYPSTPVGRGADSDVPQALADAAVAAVDAAAAHGWVDPDRVGIIGQSFGGYSTASVLAVRSDRFRAGVAISGAYDFAAGWGVRIISDSMQDADSHPFTLETRGYVEDGQIGLASPPWKDPEAYRRNSPFYRAGTIRSPLLLLQGDLDLGVTSLTLAERFYAALRRTGSPAVLVRYWGQGHVQSDAWAVRDEWARAQAWFDRYVVNRAPPPKSEVAQ